MSESYSIIPDDRRVETESDISAVRAAVLVHLFYEEQVEYSKRYLERLPDSIDIIIFSSKENVLGQFQEDRYIRIKKENRGRDISALLVAAAAIVFEYQYICFIHDKKEKCKAHKEYVELWRKNMWDNMLQSPAYVYNVLAAFENDSRIGLMVPVPPHQGDKGVWLKGDWGGTFDLVRNLADEIGLSADIRYDAPPVTYSTVFWARTEMLRKLYSKEWAYTDFPDEPMKDYGEINHAVERILQYVADDAGYETRIILSAAFASGFVLQLKEEMNRIWDGIRSVFGIRDYKDLSEYGQRAEKMKAFSKRHPDLYLYGAGSAGRDCIRMCALLDIVPAGVLVTEMEEDVADMEGIPILPVSDLKVSKETGVVITVYETVYQDEIRERLDKTVFCEYMVY
ncbi:MAG: rhamnan synthesis F family protein [Lachnospiraceae bacterium]|nr:rhamnan synthesis F family protein [Lachnospiraceae bacterium]